MQEVEQRRSSCRELPALNPQAGEAVKVLLPLCLIIGTPTVKFNLTNTAMISRRYQPVLNRQQEMLLPPCVDEYVSQNNPVRAIDAYVNTLDLQALDFTNSQPVISNSHYGNVNKIKWIKL